MYRKIDSQLSSAEKKWKLDDENKIAKRKRDFKDVLNNIVNDLSKHINDDRTLYDAIVGRPGGGIKAESTEFHEKPEVFTCRCVIEPMLIYLGYSDIRYEAGIYTNRKRPDYALLCHSAPRDDGRPSCLLVEAEPLQKNLYDKDTVGVRQMERYLAINEYSFFQPWAGIVTDGMRWILVTKRLDGNGYTKYRIDLQPLFKWAYKNRFEKQTQFPENLYWTFSNVFREDHVQYYVGCLQVNHEKRIIMPDGKKVRLDSVPEDKAVDVPNRSSLSDYGAMAFGNRSLRKQDL